MGLYDNISLPVLLKPESAKGLMEYARKEDPILAFLLAVGSKAVGGFMGRKISFQTKGYDKLEKEYVDTIAKEWPAFASEVRRRNEEAGREKMPFSTIDDESYQYFTKKLEENLAKEEDPERKKILEGIRNVVKDDSFQIYNLIGDFLDPLHNHGTMEFVERYSTESLGIFSYDAKTDIHLAMMCWPERLVMAGRYDEMNEWMKQHIGVCPKECLADVFEMYDNMVTFAMDDGAPQSLDQKDAILEAWKQAHASEDLKDLDDVLKGNTYDDDMYIPENTPYMLPKPVVRDTPKIYPNDPCPCGSGKKYKKCCGRNA